jgi:hypothetical protein
MRGSPGTICPKTSRALMRGHLTKVNTVFLEKREHLTTFLCGFARGWYGPEAKYSLVRQEFGYPLRIDPAIAPLFCPALINQSCCFT